MKTSILVSQSRIVACAHKITFGLFDETFEKWKLEDEEGNILCYYVDNGFTLFRDVELPSDYENNKYLYIEGEFVLNENWKPNISLEEKIKLLEEELNKLPSGGNNDDVWDEMAVAIEEGVNEV